MIESQDREINGKTYRFTPLMAKAARDQLDQLIQKFGPSIASAIRGLENANVDADFDESELITMLPAVAGSVSGAIETFCSKLTPQYHAALIKIFFKQVECEVEADVWKRLTDDFCELHFATNLLTETRVLFFCLEVQYADFFGLLASLKNSLAAMKPKASRSRSDSPSNSTGTRIE